MAQSLRTNISETTAQHASVGQSNHSRDAHPANYYTIVLDNAKPAIGKRIIQLNALPLKRLESQYRRPYDAWFELSSREQTIQSHLKLLRSFQLVSNIATTDIRRMYANLWTLHDKAKILCLKRWKWNMRS
jgi:hypothetical protein